MSLGWDHVQMSFRGQECEGVLEGEAGRLKMRTRAHFCQQNTQPRHTSLPRSSPLSTNAPPLKAPSQALSSPSPNCSCFPPHTLDTPLTGAPLLSGSQVLPTSINFLRQLNEHDGPMLLCGGLDGAVRIWRNYTLKDGHNMATALQAVTIHLPPAHGHATAYEWSPSRSLLFAAGGSHPEMVYCWDLHYEMCSNMVGTLAAVW